MIGQEDSMPSTQIAKCISTFLACLDKDNGQNVIQLEVEGSGLDESTNAQKYSIPTESNCYQTFQECSGSVLLIPDLYNESTLENKGGDGDGTGNSET